MEKEEKILFVTAGAIIAFLLYKNNQISGVLPPLMNNNNNTVAATANVATPVLLPGQMNTVVGIRSPQTLTAADFDVMIQDNSGIMQKLANTNNGFALSNESRAEQYLKQVGWMDIFNQFENNLAAPKMQDVLVFSVNLGGNFPLLLPPASAVTVPPMPVCGSPM